MSSSAGVVGKVIGMVYVNIDRLVPLKIVREANEKDCDALSISIMEKNMVRNINYYNVFIILSASI